MLGTVAYMSPEQVRAKELDARSDLFSFGAVLYEMATGMLPFRWRKFGSHLRSHPDTGRPRPFVSIRDFRRKLEDIINKALEKDRDLRYQHASDMRTDLQRLKRDTETGRAVAASSGTSVAQESGRRSPNRLRRHLAPRPRLRRLVLERVKVAEAPVAGKKPLEDFASRRRGARHGGRRGRVLLRSHQAARR